MAAPANRPGGLPGSGATARLQRFYADSLGRPLQGWVTLYGGPTPVQAPVVDGWLRVDLPPGDYVASDALTDADGYPVPYSPSYHVTVI